MISGLQSQHTSEGADSSDNTVSVNRRLKPSAPHNDLFYQVAPPCVIYLYIPAEVRLVNFHYGGINWNKHSISIKEALVKVEQFPKSGYVV